MAIKRRGPLDPGFLWWVSCELHRRRIPILPKIIKLLNFCLYKCLLPYEARIPRDLILAHHALGMVVHPQTIIGSGCLIHQFVTIAAENVIGSEHFIKIGDRVTIGAYAILLGTGGRSLMIGDDSVIGPGSLVTKDVPAGAIVMAPPARVVGSKPSPASVSATATS